MKDPPGPAYVKLAYRTVMEALWSNGLSDVAGDGGSLLTPVPLAVNTADSGASQGRETSGAATPRRAERHSGGAKR